MVPEKKKITRVRLTFKEKLALGDLLKKSYSKYNKATVQDLELAKIFTKAAGKEVNLFTAARIRNSYDIKPVRGHNGSIPSKLEKRVERLEKIVAGLIGDKFEETGVPA